MSGVLRNMVGTLCEVSTDYFWPTLACFSLGRLLLRISLFQNPASLASDPWKSGEVDLLRASKKAGLVGAGRAL